MNRFSTTTDIVYNDNTKKDIFIAHISDLHFSCNTTTKMLNKLKDYIFNINPDYIMITGDLIDTPSITNDKDKIKELVTFLSGLGKKAKVLISIGNHDVFTSESFNFFEKLDDLYNIYVLDNKSYQDEFIFVTGFTLSNNYYYNITGRESVEMLLDDLNQHKELIDNLPKKLPKVALIHSPMRLNDNQVLKKLHEYDLILSGHTHNGLVPKWLYFLFPGNLGFIGPYNRPFPKISKGKMEKNINNKKITVIINGAITKFAKTSGPFFSRINFIYNKSVNKIIIRKKRGINYEN